MRGRVWIARADGMILVRCKKADVNLEQGCSGESGLACASLLPKPLEPSNPKP